jgi:SAM-dependent methyltransferase
MDAITRNLHDHYKTAFLAYGATSQGVDWGPHEHAAELRQDQMLKVAKKLIVGTLLDVGCGYGALADRIDAQRLQLEYTGIDVVEEMVLAARARHPSRNFLHGDFLTYGGKEKFDFVVCNGILTQKLAATTLQMNHYARRLIAALFETCRVGVAFNVMSTYVNYQVDNLYYRNPAELLAWCMSELTDSVLLDHSYPLYEYTIYLYRKESMLGSGEAHG